MSFITVIILGIGFILRSIISKSYLGIRIRQHKIEEKFIRSLLHDLSIISPFHRFYSFLIDLFICDFAFRFNVIHEYGLGYCLYCNITNVFYSFYTISPFRFPICNYYIRGGVSLAVFILPFFVLHLVCHQYINNSKRQLSITFSLTRALLMMIVVNYVSFLLSSGICIFLYNIIYVKWLIISLEVFIFIMCVFLILIVYSEILDS